MRTATSKIVTLAEAVATIGTSVRASRRVVMANGVFDLLHVGHARYLEEARRLGDVLLVAINTDASTRAYKGPSRPVIPEQERAELVAALECVDFVVLFDELNVGRVLSEVKPDVHAKGTDYSPETIPERGIVLAYGGAVAICGDPKAHSSTELIERTKRSP